MDEQINGWMNDDLLFSKELVQGADIVPNTQGCKVNKQQQKEHWQWNQLTWAPPLKTKQKIKETHIHTNVIHQGAREMASRQEKEVDKSEEGRARELSHELSTKVIYLTREAI